MGEESIAETLGEIAMEETGNSKALIRSIHIVTLGAEATVTSQDPKDTLKKIKKMAMEIIDSYKYSKSSSMDYS